MAVTVLCIMSHDKFGRRRQVVCDAGADMRAVQIG